MVPMTDEPTSSYELRAFGLSSRSPITTAGMRQLLSLYLELSETRDLPTNGLPMITPGLRVDSSPARCQYSPRT